MKIPEEDRLLAFIKGCVRRINKPDLHSFTIRLNGGMAFVEAEYGGRVYVETRIGKDDNEEVTQFTGTPVEAADRLKLFGADINTIET